MMIFVVTILALIFGFVSVLFLADKFWMVSELFGVLGGVLIVVSIIALVIEGICFLETNTCIPAKVESNRVRRESLVYQLENDIYDNDNDLGKKELYSEIQDWNEDLAYGKAMKDNFWLGIFYPNELYDEFEFIELE